MLFSSTSLSVARILAESTAASTNVTTVLNCTNVTTCNSTTLDVTPIAGGGTSTLTRTNCSTYENCSNVTVAGEQPYVCPSWCWLMGSALIIFSSFANVIGFLLQKKAHQYEQELLAQGLQPPSFLGLPMNWYWFFGFILLVIIPTPFDMAALAFAGESLILPLGTGCTVIFGQFAAQFITGEIPTRRDWFATCFITVGIVLTTAFASHHTPNYTLDELLASYVHPIFAVILTISIVFFFIFGGIYHFNFPWAKNFRLLIIAIIPSILGAYVLIVVKTIGEITKNVGTGTENAWVDARTYIFFVILIGCAVNQILLMNKGLDEFSAIYYLPIYQTILMILGVVIGAFYYKEYESLHPIGFPVGMVFISIGIFVYERKDEEETENKVIPEGAEGLEGLDRRARAAALMKKLALQDSIEKVKEQNRAKHKAGDNFASLVNKKMSEENPAEKEVVPDP
eukprot:g12.t1